MMVLEIHDMTLTKRQQKALIEAQWVSEHWPAEAPLFKSHFVQGWGGTESYFSSNTVYALMHYGYVAFYEAGIYLTPAGERLATLLAELPAPLTRRQWQILLRFRDVGSDSSLCVTASFRSTFNHPNWYLPENPADYAADTEPLFSERTRRILCDYGLLGFEYRHDHGGAQYAHLTPLGEELTSLLP